MVKVGFSTSTGWVSGIIRWATGSKISHTWILLDLDNPIYGQKKWVLEAQITGYRLIPFEGYLVGNKLVGIVPLDHSVEQGLERAMGWLGGNYDVGGVVGDLAVEVERKLKSRWRWLHLKVRNPLHEARAMYCSEAITFVLQASNYPGADKLIGENTTPQDLYNFLTKGVVPSDG